MPENKKNRTPIFGIWNEEHIILNLIYHTLPNYEDYGNQNRIRHKQNNITSMCITAIFASQLYLLAKKPDRIEMAILPVLNPECQDANAVKATNLL